VPIEFWHRQTFDGFHQTYIAQTIYQAIDQAIDQKIGILRF